MNVCSTNEGNDGCSGKQSRPTFAMWSNKFRRTLISQGPTASMHDLNEHVRRLYGNSECALMMKTLTDASEPAADMDAPKTKIAKTAVAATFEEDNVCYCVCCLLRRYQFDDTLGVLPPGATDEDRMLNKKRLQNKLDVVQEAMNDQSNRYAKNIIRWLTKEISKEHTKLKQSWIKQDKAMERQTTKEYERVDKAKRWLEREEAKLGEHPIQVQLGHTLIIQAPDTDLNEHVRRLYGNKECALMMKKLTDASEPAADLDIKLQSEEVQRGAASNAIREPFDCVLTFC